MHETWAGNAHPYQQIENEIDQALTNGQAPALLMFQNKALALKKPNDPQAQFRWGYSGWKMLTPESGSWDKDRFLNGVYGALVKAPSPNTYEYARLRFLVSPDSSQLVALGERLLKRNPNDMDVKYKLIGDYYGLISLNGLHSKKVDPATKERVLAIAQQMLQANPTVAKYYSSLGGVYLTCWVVLRDQDDAAKAIVEYKKFLQLAPANDEFRPQAHNIIEILQNPSSPLAKQ